MTKGKRIKGSTVVVPNKDGASRKLILSLSGSALSVLLYGVTSMAPHRQDVTIRRSDCMILLKMNTEKTFYIAIRELIDKGVLVKSKREEYIVNKNLYSCKFDYECDNETGFIVGSYVKGGGDESK
jgi:hypothetical protein